MRKNKTNDHEAAVAAFLASVNFDMKTADWLTDRQMQARSEREIPVGGAEEVAGVARKAGRPYGFRTVGTAETNP